MALCRKAYAYHKQMIDGKIDLHDIFDLDNVSLFPDFVSFANRINNLINLNIYDLIMEIVVEFELDDRKDGFLYQYLDYVLDNRLNIGLTLTDFFGMVGDEEG